MTALIVAVTSPNYGSGGGGGYSPTYRYMSYDDDEDGELEKKRKKTKHAEVVHEAAVEAVTSRYSASKDIQDTLALQKLATMADELSFEITKVDRILLKMEVKRLRKQRDIEDEEALLVLMC